MFQQKFKVRTVIPLLLRLKLGQQFNNSGQELLVTVKNMSVSKLCPKHTEEHDATMLSQTNEQSSSYVIWHVVSSSFDCSLTKGTSDSPFFPQMSTETTSSILLLFKTHHKFEILFWEWSWNAKNKVSFHSVYSCYHSVFMFQNRTEFLVAKRHFQVSCH